MDVMLEGVDGSNPVGFLAALGALTLASGPLEGDLRLSWSRPASSWHPVLSRPASLDEDQLVAAIVEGHDQRDLQSELGWDRDLMNVTRDEVRALLISRLEGGDARAARMVSACLGELPVRQRGSELLAPYTPFRLIPRMGRARFLATMLSLSDVGSSATDLVERALFEPWRYTKANSLRWDPGATVPARAYTAEAPTHFGPLGVPGAMLLAVAGLIFFPLMVSRGQPSCGGFGRSSGRVLCWPIWRSGLDEPSVRMLLGLSALYEQEPDASLLRRYGIEARMAARRERLGPDDQMLSWGEPTVLWESEFAD